MTDPKTWTAAVAVAGKMNCSLLDFERRCDVIALLCDAVRLSREYGDSPFAPDLASDADDRAKSPPVSRAPQGGIPTLTHGEALDVLAAWALGQTMNERQLLAALWELRDEIRDGVLSAAPRETRGEPRQDLADAVDVLNARLLEAYATVCRERDEANKEVRRLRDELRSHVGYLAAAVLNMGGTFGISRFVLAELPDVYLTSREDHDTRGIVFSARRKLSSNPPRSPSEDQR